MSGDDKKLKERLQIVRDEKLQEVIGDQVNVLTDSDRREIQRWQNIRWTMSVFQAYEKHREFVLHRQGEEELVLRVFPSQKWSRFSRRLSESD